MSYNFGGFDEHGNILCLHCKEYTNEGYVAVPDLVCWNCGSKLHGDHIEIIHAIHDWYKKQRNESKHP
jgi:hypothetical protein